MYIKILLSFIMKISGSLASFLFTFLVAKRLSISDAGVFFMCITVVTILNTICLQGMENILVRYFSVKRRDDEFVPRLYSWVIKKTMIAAIVISIVWVGGYWLFLVNGGVINLPPFFILILIPMVVCYVNFFVYQGAENAIFSNLSQTLIPYCVSSIIIFFLHAPDVFDVIFAFLLSLIVSAAVFTILIYFEYNVKFSSSLLCLEEKALRIEAKNLLFVSVFMLLGQWGGQLSIYIFSSTENVAIFTIAQRIALIFTVTMLAVNFVISSKYARLLDEEKFELLKEINKKVSLVLLLLSIFLISIVFSFSKDILLIFGSEYESGEYILDILCFGQAVNIVFCPFFYLLIMSGNSNALKKAVIISNLFSLFSFPVAYFSGSMELISTVLMLGVILQCTLCYVFSRRLVPRAF